jgi:hypothetical protein
MYNTAWTAYVRDGSWAEPDVPISGGAKLQLSVGIWSIAFTSDDGDLYVIQPNTKQSLLVGAVDDLRDEYPRNDGYECRCYLSFSHAEILVGCRKSFPSLRSSSLCASSSCGATIC